MYTLYCQDTVQNCASVDASVDAGSGASAGVTCSDTAYCQDTDKHRKHRAGAGSDAGIAVTQHTVRIPSNTVQAQVQVQVKA